MSQHDTTEWSVLNKLKPFLQEAWKQSGFQKPTNIQTEAIPTIMEKKDVICESPTGTGKTLAYLIPTLEKIDAESQHIQAVVIAPSRELVMQIHSEIQSWASASDIRSASFIGGANVKKQLEKLKKRPQIIVGTTGRIMELIKAKKLKMHEVSTIVADEADQLTLPEHRRHLEDIIKTTLKDQRQLIFFSATIGKETERVAKEMMVSPSIIKVEQNKADKLKVEHLYLVSERREKMTMLRSILHSFTGKTLIFVKDGETAEEVQRKLQFHHINVDILDGMSKKQEREAAMRNFRKNKVATLVVTDLAARGLDIRNVSHVIQFDIPREYKQYVHRSGRTGRMGAMGFVISIVTQQEVRDVKRFCKELGVKAIRKNLYKGELIDHIMKKEEKGKRRSKKSLPNKKNKKS
ncbi:DEAD/DEAH box helicase [Bacillus spongiae]|uniref:DEAD/DEAH box helicase n=1 Tax=Bacillus spongiae TaxID=2683610 RepID=A0ABU8HIC5_9BACI